MKFKLSVKVKRWREECGKEEHRKAARIQAMQDKCNSHPRKFKTSRQIQWCLPFKEVWLQRPFKEQEHRFMNQADLLRLVICLGTYSMEMTTPIDLARHIRWIMLLAKQWMSSKLQQIKWELAVLWMHHTQLSALLLLNRIQKRQRTRCLLTLRLTRRRLSI